MPDNGASVNVWAVLVGLGDIEDVRVFDTYEAALAFQTQNMSWHSAPFECEVESNAR